MYTKVSFGQVIKNCNAKVSIANFSAHNKPSYKHTIGTHHRHICFCTTFPFLEHCSSVV